MEQWIGSKLGKEYIKAVYYHPAYLANMPKCIMRTAGLYEAQIGIRIDRRSINNLKDADDITLMAESKKELKRLLMNMKEECEKAGLKLTIQKTKTMASSPIMSWWIDGETMETVTDFFWRGAPKSLQMIVVAMKLKDTCSLEENLWTTQKAY